MKSKMLIGLVSIMMALSSCQKHPSTQHSFVSIRNGHFVLGDSTYRYIGANYWYGAILASTGVNGNRSRLLKELDILKAHGINNLRVLAGADGPSNIPLRTTPTLQIKPGVYNDTLLVGLDYLLAEMGKRHMKAILYLNNCWDWSGGFVQYLQWTGHGTPPLMSSPNGWQKYQHYTTQFYECDSCQQLYRNDIRFLLNRTNTVTGKLYRDDPAIMAWEIANEPRPLSEANKPAMARWIHSVAALIKSIDPNHLVTTGSEGSMGCEGDIRLFEKIHADPDIDYLTIHIWPKNWGWIKDDSIPQMVDQAIQKTDAYLDRHIAVAKRLNKPIVLEEFGLPRDNYHFTPDAPITARNKYYTHIFKRLLKAKQANSVWDGCNFWAFGGLTRPNHIFWKPGDALMGDPGQEEQGLNSVYNTDSTMKIIARFNQQLQK